MKNTLFFVVFLVSLMIIGCQANEKKEVWASDILGNPEYQAISYGGYRAFTRDTVPTVAQIKEDMRIIHTMGIRIIRTYNTQQYDQVANLVEAIYQMKEEDPSFEMYIMLGAWIDCQGAWNDNPDHTKEDLENNMAEIDAAVELANKYPGIIKIIAVGNEAMVHWATSYFVEPWVILKWVNYLQDLKKKGALDSRIWITSSDNYASWGGADDSYHNSDLEALIEAVDFISVHTYPYHETHYNPVFWGVNADDEKLDKMQQIDSSMSRSIDFAKTQYESVLTYIENLGIEKPVHIGETGWSTRDNSFFDKDGSAAADEYKQKLYYEGMRAWTDSDSISCFFFEAFNEKWKDDTHRNGSENHFGLFTIDGQAKYTLWDELDSGLFNGLERNGHPISKTYNGNSEDLFKDVFPPPFNRNMGFKSILSVNEKRNASDKVTEHIYVVVDPSKDPGKSQDMTYPSAPLQLNPWEGTCSIEMSKDGVIEIKTSADGWWGCGLEIQANDFGEDLSGYDKGFIHFDIKGDTRTSFQFGFQTGLYFDGDQTNNFVFIGPKRKIRLSNEWRSYAIPISEMSHGADLSDVTSLIYLRADENTDGGFISLKNIWYSMR